MKLHLVFLTLLAASTVGCTPSSKLDMWRLVTHGRDGWQLPEQVIDALALEPGDRVAEIGAGKGYWLPFLAEAVGSEGLVYAVEVTDDLVALLEERVKRDELTNVVVVRGQFADPRLPDGEIDVAMTSLTYHHIEGQTMYFRNLTVDLSPRGRVVHLDDRPDAPVPFGWFQSRGHWTDPATMRAEMGDAGYQQVEAFEFLPLQSFQIFVPVGAVDPRDMAEEAP